MASDLPLYPKVVAHAFTARARCTGVIQVSAGEFSATRVTDVILRSTGKGTLSQHGLKHLT